MEEAAPEERLCNEAGVSARPGALETELEEPELLGILDPLGEEAGVQDPSPLEQQEGLRALELSCSGCRAPPPSR